MSTYTVAGQVTFAGSGTGINGVTITVTRVSGTADASSPYTFTTSGSGANAGKFSGGTLVDGTTYSIAATDGSLTFSTQPNFAVTTSNITGENFTLTPTISVVPSSVAFSSSDKQEELIVATVGNDVEGTASWASSDTAVATVNSDGLVSVMSAGSATITASVTDDTNIIATCSLSIGSGVSIVLSASQANLLQSVLRQQVQAGYMDNPFTASQSADVLAILAALAKAV